MTVPGRPSLPLRQVSRVLLLTDEAHLLLVRYPENAASDPPRPAFWVPPGGAIHAGESFQAAAVRELREETGVDLDKIGPHVWTRELEILAGGVLVHQHERVFLAHVAERSEVGVGDGLEGIVEVCWWPIAALQASVEVFYPRRLPQMVGALADGDIPNAPILLSAD